jgi:lysophospholipase L1-like esterase
MKQRWMVVLMILCLAGVAGAQVAAPAAPTTAPAKPQLADVPAPKLAKDGGPNQDFLAKHARFVERAKKGDIDLLFMGDSITAGWDGKGKRVWTERYANRKAANFGIGGDRTQHVLWRAMDGELENIHPKVVVLMIGTNNSNSDPAEQIASGVTKIVQYVREKTGAKVLLLAIFPRGQTEQKVHAQREKIRQVNQTIAKLDDGQNVRYLDLWDKFTDADGNISPDIMPDFLHPNDKGYVIWADAMEPLLSEMLGAGK